MNRTTLALAIAAVSLAAPIPALSAPFVPVLSYSYSPDRSLPAPLAGAILDSTSHIYFHAPKDRDLTLSWNPNKVAVDGYNVHSGGDITVSNGKLGAPVLHDPAKFVDRPVSGGAIGATQKAVEVVYKQSYLIQNAGIRADRNICFRLTAYDRVGESGFSKGVCTILSDIASVSYYLDDPDAVALPAKTELATPYDYTLDLSALALSDGAHTVTVVLKYTHNDPAVDSYTTEFTVAKKPAVPSGLELVR